MTTINDCQLMLGDCLKRMSKIPDQSVDMILADLPYGTTRCKWDIIIPFEPLWEHYWRLIKLNGAVVLFGSEPFSSNLRMSQIRYYRYDFIWHKTQATGHLNAQKQPLRQHEVISIFYKSLLNYNPQIVDKKKENIRPPQRGKQPETYGKSVQNSPRKLPINKTYPRSVIQFANCNKGESGLHPTQKPVALLEYLIRTYTNEGETVLDNVMGSGSTGVACLNTGRRFIGIEKDPSYFAIATKRLMEVSNGKATR